MKKVTLTALSIFALFTFRVAFSTTVLDIAAYPGTTEIKNAENEFLKYPIATSISDSNELIVENIEGRYNHKLFQGSESASIDLAGRNLQATLTENDFNIVFQCNNEGCLGNLVQILFENNSIKLNYSSVEYSGPVYNDFYYILGTKKVANETIYLAYFVYKYSGNPLYIAQDIIVESVATSTPLSMDIRFDEIETSGKVILNGVFFDHNSDQLTEDSGKQMELIAHYLKNNLEQTFLIVGHTDSIGNVPYNIDLSLRRANTVKNYLVKNHGINSSRLEVHGIGPLSPKTTNSSEQGRSSNRRVELVLLYRRPD